jgi:very-short-patch-repair endonuclease
MFRERLHPRVSNAEVEVFKVLSASGLTGGLVTQQPIVLKSTVPDFCWPQLRKVVYLDGSQVHAKSKVEARDEEIDCLLELQGWQVLRIRYDAPLSKLGLQQVLAKIRGFLGLEGSM